jgi:hypothetical protein
MNCTGSPAPRWRFAFLGNTGTPACAATPSTVNTARKPTRPQRTPRRAAWKAPKMPHFSAILSRSESTLAQTYENKSLYLSQNQRLQKT